MKYIAMCLAMLLSACSLYPTMPEKSRAELIQRGLAEGMPNIDVADARDLVSGLRGVIADAANSRQKTSIVLNELMFYGTLVAVGGTIADSIAARNTGGGVAAIGGIFAGHYQVGVQRAAMQAAVDKLDCVRDALAPISPGVRQLFAADFSDTGNAAALPPVAGIRGDYDKIPGTTLRAVRSIQDKLRVALAGISLSTPSKDELAAVFDKFIAAKKDAEAKTTTPAPAAANASMLLALNNVRVKFAAPIGNGCEKPTMPDKATRERCEVEALNSLSDEQIADAKRRFELAVRTFETTIDACIATP